MFRHFVSFFSPNSLLSSFHSVTIQFSVCSALIPLICRNRMFLHSCALRRNAVHSIRTVFSLYALFSLSISRARHPAPSLPVPIYTSTIRFMHQKSVQNQSTGDESYSAILLPNLSIHKFQNVVSSLIQHPCSIPASVAFPVSSECIGV